MPEDTSEVAELLSEFNTKISDLESRHELLRERVISFGGGFVKSRDDLKKELNLVKGDISKLQDTIGNIQENLRYILAQLDNFVRKEQLQTFEKYIKLWEPLKFARTEDVQKMIDDALRNEANAGKEALAG
ncbi:hypothetical protein J4433_03280 [Candidatus Pacearchaeota archaeon]|nr:hypothetical protein [Candidatus Pacearchaeota archaeon]